jgi:hypothetical protein
MGLKRIFGRKRDEIIGAWSRQQNEELYSLYPSPNRPVITMINSRRMRWKGYVARERRGMRTGFL